MMNIGLLHRCENNFVACFSEVYQDEILIRFRDDKMKDMYDHNFTVIKGEHSRAELQLIIQDEVQRCMAEEKDFCQIRIDSSIDAESLMVLGWVPKITRYAVFYMEDEKNFCGHGNANCEIYRADNAERARDRGCIELVSYQDNFGKDFCRRKAERNTAVYLAADGVDTYICYIGGQPVGKADLFICDDTAMIEDFDVIPEAQRNGYGTALLRYLVRLAFRSRVKTVFLVTDMDDTAREMYTKLGFTYAPGYTQLFYSMKE